jgi:hypothetical protein
MPKTRFSLARRDDGLFFGRAAEIFSSTRQKPDP